MSLRALSVLAILLVACSRPSGEVASETAPGAVVFDFAARFDARHAGVEVRHVDFGTRAGRAHLRRGWSMDEESEEATWVWSEGRSSSLDVFLVEPRELSLRFRCAPPPFEGLPEQRLTLEINDRAVAEITLEPRWKEYEVKMPADTWRRGQNRIRFRYAFHRSPAESGGDPGDHRKIAVAWDWLRIGEGSREAPVTRPLAEGGVLLLPLSSQVDYYLKIPRGSRLVVPRPEPWSVEGGAAAFRAEVTVETGNGAARAFPVGENGLRVSLADLAGRFARVSFRAEPDPAWFPRALARIGLASDPARSGVAFPGAVLQAEEAVESPRPDEDEDEDNGKRRRPNVLVYLIDTLRADHLGCYGYERPVSPHIDRFAADAVRFEHPFAQSSWTRSSVVSLLTGLYPQTHGVTGRKHSLPEDVDTLSERLHELGYETAGFVTNGNVAPGWGFRQGFDRYEALGEQKTREIHQLSDVLNARAFSWLEARADRERPFFLYLHATDPHAPYTPREPYRSRFAPGVDPALGEIESVKRISAGRRELDEAARQALIDLYDAEIAFNDESFGALLAKLRELGLYDSTLIVLVSDHGEEFFDHGGWQHGQTLYQEQLRIPFVIRLPGGRAAGKTVDGLAQLADVMPTVLEYVGQPVPAGVEGESLLGAMVDRADADSAARTGVAHLSLDRRRMEAVVEGTRKLIRWLPARLDARAELYDLELDPGERRDLAAERSIEAGYLHTRLDEVSRSGTALASRSVEIAPEIEERLRALGYLQ